MHTGCLWCTRVSCPPPFPMHALSTHARGTSTQRSIYKTKQPQTRNINESTPSSHHGGIRGRTKARRKQASCYITYLLAVESVSLSITLGRYLHGWAQDSKCYCFSKMSSLYALTQQKIDQIIAEIFSNPGIISHMNCIFVNETNIIFFIQWSLRPLLLLSGPSVSLHLPC